VKQGNTIQTQHSTWQGIVMLALVINVHRTLLLFQELVWIAESACESVLIFIYIDYFTPGSAGRKNNLNCLEGHTEDH
jgi:hypothetical protein